MADTDPASDRVINVEELNDRRVRLELAYVYATLHSGGPVETEKSKDLSAFIEKMMPVVMEGKWITS